MEPSQNIAIAVVRGHRPLGYVVRTVKELSAYLESLNLKADDKLIIRPVIS